MKNWSNKMNEIEEKTAKSSFVRFSSCCAFRKVAFIACTHTHAHKQQTHTNCAPINFSVWNSNDVFVIKNYGGFYFGFGIEMKWFILDGKCAPLKILVKANNCN